MNYTHNELSRRIASEWQDVVLQMSRARATFFAMGEVHSAEVRILSREIEIIGRVMDRHCERVANANGHTKDSNTFGTELLPLAAASEEPIVNGNGQAPSDEIGASDGGQVSSPGDLAAAPTSTIEDHIQLMIAQLDELMPKKPDHQTYEVALKMLFRARSHARDGKVVLAERQLKAAINAMGDACEMEMA